MESTVKSATAKSEATYATILAAAYDMAGAEGLGKVSLGELAKRTGISKSGIFSRVGSLEALQSAVLDEYDRRFSEEVFLPSLEVPRGLPRLTVQVELWLKKIGNETARGGCLYTAGAFEFDDVPGPLRDRIEEGVNRWRASMRKTVLQAMELGHLRPDTEPGQLVFEIYSLAIGVMHDARFLRADATPRRVQRAFNRLISTYRSFGDLA